MIGKVLEVFTEYIGIILCIHKVSGKKVKVNWSSLLDLVCYMLIAFAVENISFGKIIMFAYWLIYIKLRISNVWKQAIKTYAVTICVIPMLQLWIYAVISIKMLELVDVYFVVIFINILIICIFLVWKQRYLFALMNIVSKFRKVIFLILSIMLFYYIISYYLKYKMIESYYIDQLAICFLIVVLMLLLWMNAENEKKHKEEELRTYQLYTKTFEDAVTTIRMKQHEFDNHINAIKCMRYTIQNTEELFNEQDKYCDRILHENKYNRLLKLNMSPILTGYLYSKFMAASAHNINITYEINDINVEYIAINDLIEIIGVLFDNAVEALEEQGDEEMEVKLLKIDNKFIISIANISNWRTNSEIEKFFEYGYSTKGKEHGVGLYRINTLLKKYKANIQVENITKNNTNYLCFKIVF